MEINMFEFKDEKNLENLDKMIHSPIIYELTHNMSLAFVNLIENKSFSSLLLMGGYTYTYLNLLRSIVNKTNEEIIEEIKDTDQYKECLERYNEYLSSIANAFEFTNLTNSLEYSLLYTELLHQGYFSITGEYTYKIEQYDKYNLLELMGVRVLEGHAICKHVSVFLGNLLEKLSIKAYQQYCRASNIGEVKLNDLLYRKKANHLITSIIENNKKIFIDPMNRSNPFITENSKKTDFSISHMIFPYQTNFGIYNFFNDDASFQLVNESLKEKKLQDVPLVSIEKEILEEVRYKIMQCLIIYEEFFNEVKLDQLENMKRIVELENMLIPHGDSKPKVWILK